EPARGIRCPTLVFHPTRDQAMPLEEGRSLAALIPGARFIPVDSENHMPLATDADFPATIREVKSFLVLAESAAVTTNGALTARQIEVLRLVADGNTDKQVARALGLSPRTVEMHVAGALEALQAHSRAEAVRKAIERGLLSNVARLR